MATDVVQEIETLLWVVRPWKTWIWKRWNSPCGNRSCNWREPRSSNVSTPTPAMGEARELVVVVGRKRAWSGRRNKQVQSVLGPLQLERAYCHRSSGRHGFCPLRWASGQKNTSPSPALTRMVGTVGATVSFQEGSELLTELPACLDAKQMKIQLQNLGKEYLLKMNGCTP